MTNIKLGTVWIKNVCKSYGQMIKLSSDGVSSEANFNTKQSIFMLFFYDSEVR